MSSGEGNASGEYVLGYWRIRGLAAMSRMALHYSGTPYTDKMYDLGKLPDGRWRGDWSPAAKAMRESGTCAFPNLPYLVTPSGATIVQSGAIVRHLGRKFGLCGANEEEAMRVDEAMEQLHDLRTDMARNFYGDWNETEFVKDVLGYFLPTFEQHMQLHGKNFIAGTSAPSIADFNAYDAFTTLAPLIGGGEAFAEKYPLLAAMTKRVEELPQLATYFSGPLPKLPPNNKPAHWGNEPL